MAVGPLSHSAIIKGGQAGAREPTFAVPTVPPTNPNDLRPIKEALKRGGLAHLASDT
jgi:hypothetical protein